MKSRVVRRLIFGQKFSRILEKCIQKVWSLCLIVFNGPSTSLPQGQGPIKSRPWSFKNMFKKNQFKIDINIYLQIFLERQFWVTCVLWIIFVFIDYFCKLLKIVKKYLNNFPLVKNKMLKSRIFSVYGQKVLILKCSISCAKDELR